METDKGDLDKEYLTEKYKEMFKYCCYNDDKLCNELSVNFNYMCNKCTKNNKNTNIDIKKNIENYTSKENLIVVSIKNNLIECEKCVDKPPEEERKVYKAKLCLDIYKILYYNPIFNIRYPKFLIENIRKASELIDTEQIFFDKFIEANEEYKFIYEYMININNFYKEFEHINKISLDKNMKAVDYTKFLDEYLKFISNLYENAISKNINTETETDIDINNLDKYCFVLDL